MVQDRRVPDLDALADFIRARRRELGLTQVQLAERLIWEQKRVSNLESAKYGLPSLPLLAHLADALEVPLSSVLRALGYLQVTSEAVQQAEEESSSCAALLFCLEQLLAIRETGFEAVFAASSGVIAEAMGAEVVAVYIVDPHGSYLDLVGTNTRHSTDQLRELGLGRIPVGDPGRLAAVFRSGEPYATGQAGQDGHLSSGFREITRSRSLLVAPIASVERYGILIASSIHPERFPEEDGSFFRAVANWLGLVAHRSLLLRSSG